MCPGVYFRLLLIGFFEGIASERGICWRVADSLRGCGKTRFLKSAGNGAKKLRARTSQDEPLGYRWTFSIPRKIIKTIASEFFRSLLSLRRFLNYGLGEATPDHVTMSRTRRLLDEATHQGVFTFVLTEVARRGMLKGKTIGIDATTLEANAAMRSIVRRDTGQSYMEYLRQLAAEAGIDPNDDAAVRRMDRKREKKTSNEEWVNPHDPDAEVMKMKHGSTHLAYKAEHAVDLDTGAIV